jgi:superoxide dismutase
MFALPKVKYPVDALEPYIDAKTMEITIILNITKLM